MSNKHDTEDTDTMPIITRTEPQQLPLIQIVDESEAILLASAGADWYRILHDFPWQQYQNFAAHYYDLLYQFNLNEAEKRSERELEDEWWENGETREEAAQRLLFDRAGMRKLAGEKPPIIYQGKVIEADTTVDPEALAPGIVPERLAGRKPKCFFAMFKSFLGVTLMGFTPEPETVNMLLTTNLNFLRVCGFVPKGTKDGYEFSHAPTVRKLEQFDQIMTESGLWNRIKLDEIARNLREGAIKKETELVADTTHYYAYSGFQTVTYTDENGEEKKKSQSKVTKRCRCADQETCRHEWVLADEGAGTIVKSNKQMHWGHKASIIGLPKQGVPLDAAAVTDAAIHDSETLYPHMEKLFAELPELKDWIDRVLYDSACDGEELKTKFQEDLGIELKASLNPRRKKEITENLPRGIAKITPHGDPICLDGFMFDYKGMRYETEKFIYQAPVDKDGVPVCTRCWRKSACCPNAREVRTITVSFDALPHINPKDPPMAKRFKAIMSRRPAVERMIKRLKCDLSDDRLSKRGTASFQAYLDKTMIAFHHLLRR